VLRLPKVSEELRRHSTRLALGADAEEPACSKQCPDLGQDFRDFSGQLVESPAVVRRERWLTVLPDQVTKQRGVASPQRQDPPRYRPVVPNADDFPT